MLAAFCPSCGAKNEGGGAFCGRCGANLGAAVSPAPLPIAQPVVAVAAPTQVAQAAHVPVPVTQPDGCCSGPNGCMGSVILILCILNLGTLPISIPGIMLASNLMRCCCQEHNTRCLAKITAWLAWICTFIKLLYGILLLVVLGDIYCASIFSMDLDAYRDNKATINTGCILAGAWDPDAKARCDLCNFLRRTLGAMTIVSSLVLDMPVAICSTLVTCRKKGSLPGERDMAA